MGNYFSTQRKYGWKRDHFDTRDYVHTFLSNNSKKNVDLTEKRK